MNTFSTVAATTGGALRLSILGGIVVGMSLASQLHAAKLAERRQKAEKLVQEALRNEVKDANARRDGLLYLALKEDPDHAPARWHSGYVRHRDEWVKYDRWPKMVDTDTRYVAYRLAREKAPETVEGQLELANWCARRKLAGQERVHLTNVLGLDANHAEARRRLGFRWIDGEWLSEEKLAESRESAEKEAAALKVWVPKITAIRTSLLDESQARRKVGLERLLAIEDPAAVLAIESVFCSHSEEMAEYGIRALARMKTNDASRALARQAVFSPSERIRKMATQQLRGREMFGYVPALLSAMGSPIHTKAELYTAPNGRLTYRHLLVREGQDRNEVSVFETEYRNTVLSVNPAAARHILQQQRQQDAATKAQAIEFDVARQNMAIQQFNQRVGEVLATATGETPKKSPEEWWKWWNNRNEIAYTGKKPVKARYRRTEVAFADPFEGSYVPESDSSTSVSRPTSLRRRRYECLVAGTPVWTNVGPVAVEKILPGDMVLSQNPETGELAYKPVLRTTIRAAGPLLRIHAEDAVIRCSGGHPFWVSGSGWVKAREMKPGMPLHAVDGTLQIDSVESEEAAKTYNLIVVDFHTYFAGKAMVLSHDNTIRQPTDAIVPGLAD